MHSVKREGKEPMVGGILLLLALVTVVLVVGLWPNRIDFSIPWQSEGDVLHHLAILKSMSETQWYWHIARLSAPFSLPMVDFPVGGFFDYLVMWVIVNITGSGIVGLNVFFIFQFYGSATVSYLVLKDFFSQGFFRIGVSLLFSFSPFVFYRQEAHIMLSVYLLPAIVCLCVHCLSGSWVTLTRTSKYLYYTGAIFMGLNYFYFSFFSAFFLIASFLFLILNREKMGSLVPLSIAFGLVVLATALSVMPSLVNLDGDVVAYSNLHGFKTAVESEIYGLKIRHLLSPTSSFPFFYLANQFGLSGNIVFPFDNENITARFGLVGSLAFLAILFWGLSRLAAGRPGREDQSRVLGGLFALLIAGTLLATVGGFGSIFNLVISPEVRAYNRISPFLFFISLFGGAVLLSNVSGLFSKSIAIYIIPVIVGLGLVDQSQFGLVVARYNASRILSERYKVFVSNVEAGLPRRAMVYQIPYVAYPTTPKVFGLKAHSHLLAYVWSKELRWSWPALSGAAISLNRLLGKLGPINKINSLVALGFSAVWIDQKGLADRGRALEQTIIDLGGAVRAKEQELDIAVFDLEGVRRRLVAARSEEWLEQYGRNLLLSIQGVLGREGVIDFGAEGNIDFFIGRGWSGQEANFRWTEGQEASIEFSIVSGKILPCNLVFLFDTFLPSRRPTQHVSFFVNGRLSMSVYLSASSQVEKVSVDLSKDSLRLDRKYRIKVQISDPRSPLETGVSGDARKLGIAMRKLVLTNCKGVSN